MKDLTLTIALVLCTLLFMLLCHNNETEKIKTKNTTCEKSVLEIPTEKEFDISMADVKPTQWFLPEQIKTPKYNCKVESDWPDNIKCPSHHPYIWSKVNTVKRVSTLNSKYGAVQCSVSIICSNIKDADAIGTIWSN